MMDMTPSFSTLSVLELMHGSLIIKAVGIEKCDTLMNSDSLRRMRDLEHPIFCKGDRNRAYFLGKDIFYSRNRLGSKCS